MGIVVFNAGSTSLKFGLFHSDTLESLTSGSIDWADGNRSRAKCTLRRGQQSAILSTVDVSGEGAAASRAVQALLETHKIKAVGHRVVHGGANSESAAIIDEALKTRIASLAELAPLHNPPALQAIQAAENALPRTPQVAVFDTGFFAELPERAYLFPVPYEWYERLGVRRFGFHGISNAYCVERTAEMLGRDLCELRIAICHLGGGCSVTAVRGGKPVTTTMGMTPLAGIMMGTRSGSLDPGVLIHLQRHLDLTIEEIDEVLTYRSGLFGISGISSDMAAIEMAAAKGNSRAQLTFEMFVDSVRSAIGAAVVSMGGIDALVFTDRIGEGSANVRAAVCEGLECVGVRLNAARNIACDPDVDVAITDSQARVLVIHTKEELMIARETRRLIGLSI